MAPLDPKLKAAMATFGLAGPKAEGDVAKALDVLDAFKRQHDTPMQPAPAKTDEYDPHRVIECVVCGASEDLKKCARCRSTVYATRPSMRS